MECKCSFLFSVLLSICFLMFASGRSIDGVIFPPPFDLRVNYISDPIGVESSRPVFTWALDSMQTKQTSAYLRIWKASSSSHDIVWSFTTNNSIQSIRPTHPLTQLQPHTAYHWDVQAFNGTISSKISNPHLFVTSVWKDWHALPIWSPNVTASFVYLRKEIALPSELINATAKSPLRAFAFVTAQPQVTKGQNAKLLGAYKLWINGHLVGTGPGRVGVCGPVIVPNGPFTSNNCTHEHIVDGYDVSSFFNTSKIRHTFAAACYNDATFSSKNYMSPKFLLQVEFSVNNPKDVHNPITYTTVTDQSWSAFNADVYKNPTCCEDGYHSYQPHEYMDARYEPIGWQQMHFVPNGSVWSNASIRNPFRAPLVSRQTLPISVEENRKPESIILLSSSPLHYFFDMGREIQGGLKVTITLGSNVNVANATKIEVRLGEELSGPHSVMYKMRTGNLYQDFWTLPSTSRTKIKFEHHEYKEWRYGEILATNLFDEELEIDIEAWVVKYPSNYSQAKMDSSSALLNKIWEFSRYTIEATTIDMYTDSNTRQRDPVCQESVNINALSHYAVAPELAFPRYTLEYAINTPFSQLSLPPGQWPAEWYPLTLMAIKDWWMHSGDTSMIQKYYELFRNMTLERFISPLGIIDCGTSAPTSNASCSTLEIDWPSIYRDHTELCARQPDGSAHCVDSGKHTKGKASISTLLSAYVYRGLRDFSAMANAIGRSEDAKHYETVANALRTSMNKIMFLDTKGIYTDSLINWTNHTSWHSNVFPLAFGIPTVKNAQTIFDYIISRSEEKPTIGMPGGVYMAQWFLEALYNYDLDHGHAALRVLLANGTNSWAHMLSVGATTTMEAWTRKGKPNLTWSHPWAASPVNIIVRFLFGVVPTIAGWYQFDIKPRPGSLTTASINVPTIRGIITVSFKQIFSNTNAQSLAYFNLNVTVPGNTVARAFVPWSATTYINNRKHEKEKPDSPSSVVFVNHVKYTVGKDDRVEIIGNYICIRGLPAGFHTITSHSESYLNV